MKKLALCFACLLSSAAGQSRSVELLGVITADQAAHGLGFNLDDRQQWQWAAAAAAGASYARFQCSWNEVEKQSAPPGNVAATPQYVEPPACAQGLENARLFGMHPTVVAAFGPPFHSILTATLATSAALGDTTLRIDLHSGTAGEDFRNLAYPYNYVIAPGNMQFTSRHSYEGALITHADLTDRYHAVLSLASAVKKPISAGSVLTINEILYPSAASGRPDDPSVVAYGNYVSFLTKEMAAHGVAGDVELWNEPPWANDPWDNRCALYDPALLPGYCTTSSSPPLGVLQNGYPNFGFVANLQEKQLPPGVTLTWNGTSGSGASSILLPRMRRVTGVEARQPVTTVTKESFHPYGNTPEQGVVSLPCLQVAVRGEARYQDCQLPGEPRGQNLFVALIADLKAKLVNPAFGVGHDITETGILPPAPGLEMAKARFVLRHYLAYQADGITPIEFFKFCVPGSAATSFSFVQIAGKNCTAAGYGSYTPTPSLTALAGLMSDLKAISARAAGGIGKPRTLPSVRQYMGTFPLATMHMLGRRKGARTASDLFVVWQRSFSPCDAKEKCGVWITQASPAAAPVSIAVPSQMHVSSVTDLITRAKVRYTSAHETVTFPVADDPIGLLFDPIQH